ncbi:nicotinate-nucleotide adenylyltransferase [Kangiella koreensis]|uniref:Probable nicotinate-nucleotide adenylyltransferase n=1 Tax=Kangiella koreensis (strain DSM 16069 / JCM 12317 / KCTC 12182 / SW-125) TaxID=523791 RepID=C7R7J8_KANKD|nr:nicotinate-nucleotide adenylyltransferase [Kangiella koreensis]ACV25747.1 nicotinate (nicotinamide) nucleotide adenylyltransferase [Kangiella koreensis DSM 16069]
MSTSCGMVHIILGGTFDPVHLGHLRMAQEMLNRFPEAQVSLMPAAYPPHRPTPGATTEQRIEMLDLILRASPSFHLDSRELEREEASYSVVTLRNIRLEIGDNPLIFLMGTDAFAKLDSWYHWQELLELSNILVVGRPSSELPQQGPVAELYQAHKVSKPEDLAHYSCGRIGFCEMPQLDISSTYIREQIKSGFSPRFLLPDVILDYIQQHGLYGYQTHSPKGN